MTPGARELMHRTGTHPFQLLLRHQRGDWGVLDAEDRAANERAVILGGRLLSAYEVGPGKEKLWVISEWDRSATTILRPDEY
ncbi:plasmid related protein [Paraburkholderia sediminicola]|uniref:plasmid related protein n=1 Tax=Paraburkholderia sediminicola TaxID=458836 RepID=UPI0038BB1140